MTLTATAEEITAPSVGGAVSTAPVLTPAQLAAQLPCSPTAARTVRAARVSSCQVLDGIDDRLLVVVGPCSVHDVDAALTYAKALRVLADELAGDLLIVMRAYFEKPRTAVGWPGLLTDPRRDGSFAVGDGLRAARALMLEISELGLPVGTEWLSPLTPDYLGDLVSWAAIGARTAESQVHRQLASGLTMPVGMKNGSTGSIAVAADAVRAAAAPHGYLGADAAGSLAIVRTSGNPHCHVVLRGGGGPNYSAADVLATTELLRARGLPERVVIDASHGNSGKDEARQAVVAGEIATQIADGGHAIRGIMLESFLVPGRQDADARPHVFGRSITDACLGWDATIDSLRDLAEAVRLRRRS
ncbi:3-deoxy-7-phosphoheptulonate synthase [Amycolatopsis minnesotensis]|uniref:Phospho-2-dehydro-3-deoxyheptonate aldolase n=1 Tax=Amycolatopsis minnesotensis TaxID=337894 RepID=A0ABP5DDB9_9PSEU